MERRLPILLPLALLSSVVASAQGGDQDAPSRPVLPPSLTDSARAEELLAIDGHPMAPGRLPEGTTQEARDLWSRMVAGTRVAGAGPKPIRAFDVTFDARVRESGEYGNPENQIEVRFEFLDEGRGCVSGTYVNSGRRTLRGPEGDFLIEEGKVLSLASREDEASRAELDRWLAVSRSFVMLTRPEGIRLYQLRELPLLPAPPADADPLTARTLEFAGGMFLRLPFAREHMDSEEVDLVTRARELAWLEVASPDLHMVQGPARRNATKRSTIQRGMFGLDPVTGRVVLAQLWQDGAATLESAMFVRVVGWRTLESDGYLLPSALQMHGVVVDELGYWRFERWPSLKLWMLKDKAFINPAGLDLDRFRPRP